MKNYQLMVDEMTLNLYDQEYIIFSFAGWRTTYILTRQLAHQLVKENRIREK